MKDVPLIIGRIHPATFSVWDAMQIVKDHRLFMYVQVRTDVWGPEPDEYYPGMWQTFIYMPFRAPPSICAVFPNEKRVDQLVIWANDGGWTRKGYCLL